MRDTVEKEKNVGILIYPFLNNCHGILLGNSMCEIKSLQFYWEIKS